MLVGRWLRERVLERNRLEVLASDGADGLLTRRRAGGAITTAKCTSVRAGDILVISPGDLVPVDARLLGDVAESCSLDWINGESRPRRFEPGTIIPAGAFLAGRSVVDVQATSGFEGSALVDLLRTPASRDKDEPMQTPWWQSVTRFYVAAVLALATAGGARLVPDHTRPRPVARSRHGSPHRDVPVRLRARDAARVRPRAGSTPSHGPLRALPGVPRSRDGRPHRRVRQDGDGDRRRCHDREPGGPRRPARRRPPRPPPSRPPEPSSEGLRRPVGPGSSLVGVRRPRRTPSRSGPASASRSSATDATFRLGSAGWASGRRATSWPSSSSRETVAILASLSCRETLREDAADEVAALQREGFDVWLLSGDEPARGSSTSPDAAASQPTAPSAARRRRERTSGCAAHDHRRRPDGRGRDQRHPRG